MRKPVLGFPTRFDTNQAVQQRMDLTISVVTTKALTSCAVTMQLICAFLIAYAIVCFLMIQLILFRQVHQLHEVNNTMLKFLK